MTRQEYFDSIEKRITWLVVRAKTRGKQNLLELNIYLEHFFEELLNIVYGYKLKNLNKEDSNSKGVDLIDRANKLAVQVTSTATAAKINSSIDKLKEDYQGYTLKFMIIGINVQSSLAKKKYNDNKYINFSPVQDILDIDILLKEIFYSDKKNLEKIYYFCKNEVELEEIRQTSLSHEVGFRNQMLSKAKWNHETTNDSRYVKRENLVKWLDKNVNDIAVRTISIKGMGGTGKTSLLGYWAKIHSSNILRPVEGLFYWSFYVERDCNKFINCLLDYFEDSFEIDFGDSRKNYIAIDFFFQRFHEFPPILIILDGLEVLQEGMNESSYGSFIDSVLRDFILRVTSAQTLWLCITTSRFPLVDILAKREFKEKPITGVEGVEGAEILSNHGINGNLEDREMISNYLEGHPLGIKVFSAAFTSNDDRNQPLNHFNTLFEGLKSDEISDKLDKLLWFYKKNASLLQTQTLYALSIFRKGIALTTWIAVCKELMTPVEVSDYDIKLSIGNLMQIGLVLKDTIESKDMYSCHPVIRDFFNSSYLTDEPESGRLVANFLTQSPDSIEISGVASIERFIISIEVLLKINIEQDAIDIYQQRLKKGKLFIDLGVPKEAKRLYRMFFDYYELKRRKRTTIGRYIQSDMDIILDFVNPYVEYCIQLGEFHEAQKAIFFSENYRQSAVCLRWRAIISFQQGNFKDAISLCQRAITMDNIQQKKTNSKSESLIISSFLLFKIHTVTGENAKKLQKEIGELIELSSIKEFSDFEIRFPLSKLVWAIQSKNIKQIQQHIDQVEESLNPVKDWYFKLQIHIDLAEAYTLVKDYEKALLHVEYVYQKSVKESYPYILYLSSLLKAKIQYLTQGKSSTIESISNTLQLSKTNEMPLISLMALDLLLEVEGSNEDIEEQRNYYISKLGLI